MKFQTRVLRFVDAITFGEFVAHGKATAANLIDGVPWSFTYAGRHVTHENDDCYLIDAADGTGSMRFNRGDMLITDERGEVCPCKADIFAIAYEPVP